MIFDKQKVIVASSEQMVELDDESIDVIVTSPPYNVGKNYSSLEDGYSDSLPMNEYLAFLERVFRECYRVIDPTGVFFLNIGDSAQDQGKSEQVVNVAVKAGFTRLQTVIWIKSIFGKGHYTPSGGKRRLNNLWENIYILTKSKKYSIDPKLIGIPYSDKSNIGRYSEVDLRDAGDLWFIPYEVTTGHKVKKGHEAPFPIGLPYHAIRLVPNAKKILDPFVGTGSTLAAARHLGLEGIGYDLYPRKKVVEERILNNSFTPANPTLLPQLEKYSEMTAKMLIQALNNLTEEQINGIWQNLKQKERKKLLWAIEDLRISPAFLSKFTIENN